MCARERMSGVMSVEVWQVKRENDFLQQERQERLGETAVASERVLHLQHALDASKSLEVYREHIL